jgi:hypothetical protein
MPAAPDVTLEARCGRAKLIRVCELWRKLEAQGTSETNLRVFLKLFYGVASRKDLTLKQAEQHIAECSEALNKRLINTRLNHRKGAGSQ